MLLAMSYSLVALAVSIILFFIYPENFSMLILIVLIILIASIYFSIKTIKAGEEAISYGGFANEILKNDNKIKRIDNSSSEPVIQNNASREFLKDQNILDFIKNNLSSNPSNKLEFQNLENLIENLLSGSVNLSFNLTKDNKTVFENEEWFEISVQPIFLKKTNIFERPFSVEKIRKDTYIFWTMANITAKKDIDAILQEELNALHDTLDYLPAGLYICNGSYDIEYANFAFAKLISIEREKLIGRNLKELLSKGSEIPAKSSAWKGRLIFNGNNEALSCYVSQESFRQKGQIKIRAIVAENLPTEKELQDKLDVVLNKVRWLFDNSPTGTLFINKSFSIVKTNEAAKNFFGKDVEGKDLKSFINKEDFKKLHEIIDIKNDKKETDITINTDGLEKVAYIYIIPMQDTKNSKNEDYNGWVLYLTDATKQKDLEMQFAQAQKMQAMGQLAGGIAHDFNNLLTAMIGFCDLLLQRHGVGDPSFADLIQIKQNANRAAGLVRQLLAFSRKQPLKPKLIDVAENFLEINHMLKRILGENINVAFHHSDNLGFIKVDPVQFSQVIINLAVNAKDAMGTSGKISIATNVENLKSEYQFGEDIIRPGEFVVINVSDNGSGIAPENINRIFEPFFSTKQNIVGSGTGLGLSMVYGIVRQTGGFIKVKSKIGEGTTFSIYLPRYEQSDEQELKPEHKEGSAALTVKEKITPNANLSQKVILGLNVSTIDKRDISKDFDAAKIRILFVEDEDSVRSFAIRALKKKGYDVVACDSAETALEQLDINDNFNLLITDMVMPGMNGAELANIAKARIKGLKVILASGYSEEMAKRELSNSDNFEFMAKPFSLGDLNKKVFEILNSD
jgi:two-component system cell cycle sensor histidine kinase/response regulator CckA